MNTHYFDCDCSDFGHTFRFLSDGGDLWLEVHLSRWPKWHRRVRFAIKYVFNQTAPNYGHYDTTMIRREDCDRLIALLERHKAGV